MQRIFLPYVKDISELTTRLLKPYGIQVAHKPTSTLRRLVSRPKRPTTSSDQTRVVYKVQCTNCEKFYVGQTGRKLSTRMHEHQLAVKRHDPLSLISIHADAQLHSFNFSDVTVLDRAMTKGGREFLEAWHSTSDSINRHIELDNIYLPIRLKEITNRASNRTPRDAIQGKSIIQMVSQNCIESYSLFRQKVSRFPKAIHVLLLY